MIQISYDSGNPWLIVERDRTSWRVTIILYNGSNLPVIIGEGEGWDYNDAYNLAQADVSLQVKHIQSSGVHQVDLQ